MITYNLKALIMKFELMLFFAKNTFEVCDYDVVFLNLKNYTERVLNDRNPPEIF